ncbi:MAG: hypothetical protein ACI4WS_09470 [Oscillospiraceae bacterium]
MRLSTTDKVVMATAGVLAVVLFVISPLITFGLGYVGGLILNMAVGETLANGLNIVLGTTRFTQESIPLVCGTLAIIGSFFKASCVNSRSFNRKERE